MLYFVGTPIGNLKDISFRALEVLKEVDEIACEDTRHSLGLLNAYDIKKPLFSYHKFNERESGQKIIDKLIAGKNIAVITAFFFLKSACVKCSAHTQSYYLIGSKNTSVFNAFSASSKP